MRQAEITPISADPMFFGGFFCLFFSLGLHPWHMEVTRLGVESALQPPAYTAVITTSDLGHVCDLHHSSQNHWILNPVSEARDGTRILMDTSRVRYR